MKRKRTEQQAKADLLPDREVLSLLATDPAAYGSLAALGPIGGGDATGGAADAASSTASSAHNLANVDASSSGAPITSSDDQTVETSARDTASAG